MLCCRSYYFDSEAPGHCLNCGQMEEDHMIFVFGSNLSGIHGAGAAKTALLHHGAVMGIGLGMKGNSYALPTKGKNITHMPIKHVEAHVKMFLGYALKHPEMLFKITQIGCGLAGLNKEDIAPYFEDATPNCFFDSTWKPFLPKDFNFWGTFP